MINAQVGTINILHSIISVIKSPTCHVDGNKIEFANDPFLQFFGRKLDEVVGLSPAQIFDGNKAGESVMKELDRMSDNLKVSTIFGPFRLGDKTYNLKIDYLRVLGSTIIQIVDIEDDNPDIAFLKFIERYNGIPVKIAITTTNTTIYRGHRQSSPSFYIKPRTIKKGISPFGASQWIHAHRIIERDKDGRDHEVGTVFLRGDDLIRNIRVSRVELNPGAYSFHVVLKKKKNGAYRPVYRVGRGGKARRLTIGKLTDNWETLQCQPCK